MPLFAGQARSHISKLPQLPQPKKSPAHWAGLFIYQCSSSRGSVPRPVVAAGLPREEARLGTGEYGKGCALVRGASPLPHQ